MKKRSRTKERRLNTQDDGADKKERIIINIIIIIIIIIITIIIIGRLRKERTSNSWMQEVTTGIRERDRN